MILEVKDGAFSYPGQARLFSHIGLSLREGEVLAVLGPNGAGKTTLLRCIMGMLSFQEGTCRLDETEISRIPPRTLWQRIAYVPQAKGAVASCPAFEMVLLGRSSRIGPFSSPGQEDLQKAEQAMRALDILSLREKPCCALSGGEYQMVLIARALAAEPEVLILDEPESNLDFKNQLLVLQTIRRLAQSGIGCIFNTHYPAHALQWADTALLLSGGTGLFGEAGRILNEDDLSRAFGVQAVISEVETDQQIFRSVMAAAPGSLPGKKPPDDRPCIAAITIISRAELSTDDLRRILQEACKLITGCAEMPNRRAKLSITQLTLEGRRQDIDALSQRLSRLPGLSIKTTFAPPEEADFPGARQEPKLL